MALSLKSACFREEYEREREREGESERERERERDKESNGIKRKEERKKAGMI